MTNTLLILFLVLTVCGCATVELEEGGKRVKILTEQSLLSDAYEDLGEVSCQKGVNARSSGTNIIQCRNELRNRAAELGADVLVIQHQQLGSAGCGNCIVMVGVAYKLAN